MSLADFTENLTFFLTIIPHEIVNWSITSRTGTMLWNVAFHATKNRFDCFVVALLIVVDELFPVPFLFKRDNFGKLINFKFLILRRMGIVKSPLLKRNISTDKVNKPADLFMLVLNELK